ncbi:Ferrochelatase, protoheme ferro-lyase [hydrothermal vent metagenome]|uniref:Ferrochelatase, protoheme ferro-lyase n=1 Tax=hydrothermal vent metagenome TaxID=652676 RepID=A0A3B0SML1_9ZZZZ
MIDTQPVGVLLLQLGTPDSASTRDVRRYLNEFLSDPRVMDVPAPVRWLLLNTVILPFRPRKSGELYKKIWTEDGSPLLVHTKALAADVQSKLGNGYLVDFGMRYGSPTIASALDRLLARDVANIRVLPLFPQYASSAGGSATARTMELLAERWNVPSVSFLPEFYNEPGYIAAIVETARHRLEEFRPDHILFSYHGLPERQVKKADATGSHCLASDECCDTIGPVNRHCYRAQCFATTRLVAAGLDLSPDSYSTAFQSRLAGTPWITPQTDRVLQGLHDTGIRRLAVFTNSFVADCLETLEEIGIRLAKQWEELGGDELLLIPCVNESPTWVDTVVSMALNGDPG